MGVADWILRPLSLPSDSVPTEAPLPMPNAIWSALYQRGFQTKEAVDSLFSPSLANLKNPFSILNMQKGAERIVQAFEANEPIAIYADFDLDGTSGLALLYEGLKGLGFSNVQYYQPKRLTEGYGLHAHAIEELHAAGIKVIITVDVGITAVVPAEKAKELGVDLIITDHHQVGPKLPDCYAIINPNVKECTSGLGYLCGAGVAFYFLLAVRKLLLDKNIKSDFNPKDVLDFFVIGTITDLVPLVEDNRVLIKHGMTKLSQTQRPALRKLLDALGFSDRTLTSQDIAIQVAPKLNALSRMEMEYFPRDVLLETNADHASKIVENVLATQEMRKSYQKTAQIKAVEMKEDMQQEGYSWVWSHEYHKGVIGLVATRLAETYQVPAFVGSLNEKGEIVGSSRLPESSGHSLIKILDFCKSSLIQFGGHVAAAGFKLKAEDALEFDAYLTEYFSQNEESLRKTYTFDAVLKLDEINPMLMKWIAALEPFGKEFPALLYCVRGVTVSRKKVMNGGHIRFTFTQGSAKLDGVVF